MRRNQASDIEMHTLPALPIPMREGSATFVGSTLYVLITATDTGKPLHFMRLIYPQQR
ncbi:MAG: hypothetical protein ACTH59_16345 [Pseudoalteromonas nigrifaciens]|uniref:hypothetical protein n=1 Tax=Pseudoalteromonas nigrifaciens TaxID=28109 RepID=UPI003F950E5E